MIDTLELYSEPYGSTGNIGDNFRRLLGAPSLNALETVVRESIQNIADAASLGLGPEIEIRLRTLSPDQLMALREKVLRDLPQLASSREAIEAFLHRREPQVLEICDFRTIGLGGPTRADRIPVDAVRTDFIDFLRNIGTARDTVHGGGTYGFGKVALYRVSKCSTILVDTQVAGGGLGSRRITACHVGASFERPENGMRRRYTGRHWWGVPDPTDGVADPLTDESASDLSASLGLPERSIERSGTSIMILDFDTEGESLQIAGQRVLESILWNFWPRMMCDTPENRRFKCRIEVEGTQLPVPQPEDIAPLDLFTRAMRGARTGTGVDVRSIASKRPIKTLGRLAIEKGLRAPRRNFVSDGSQIPDIASHIAVMRPVELVVKYIKGSPLPDESLEWAAVFIADQDIEVERAFADSEPPAHDDWIPDNLPKGPSKTFVKVALDKLRDVAREMGDLSPTSRQAQSSGPPLARVAGRLGIALEGVGGDGAGINRGGGVGGGARPVKAKASRPVFQRLELRSGIRVAVFSTEVTQDKLKSGIYLQAEASLAVDGTASGRLNADVPQPDIIAIRSASGLTSELSQRLSINGDEGSYEIEVRLPPDGAVTVDVIVLSAAEK